MYDLLANSPYTGNTCWCIFFPFQNISVFPPNVSVTLGGLTFDIDSLKKHFQNLGGTVYIHSDGIEICVPYTKDYHYDNTLIVSGIRCESTWHEFPKFDFYNQHVFKLNISFDFTNYSDANSTLIFKFTEKDDYLIKLSNHTDKSQFRNEILWAVSNVVENCACYLSEDKKSIEVIGYAGTSVLPFEIIYTNPLKEAVPLSQYIETHSVDVWDNKENIWRRNGKQVETGDIAIDQNSLKPLAITKINKEVNALPAILTHESEGTEQGCFFVGDEDNEAVLDTSDVTLKWKSHEGVLYTQYLKGEEELALPFGGYFGDKSSGVPFELEIFKADREENTETFKYIKKCAAIRPLEPENQTAKIFAAESLDGFICMVVEGVKDFTSQRPLIQGKDNKSFSFEKNSIRLNTWSNQNSASIETEVTVKNLEDNSETTHKVKGDLKDFILTSASRCEFYVNVTYFSPVEEREDVVYGNKILIDPWYFDDIDEPYDGIEPFIFTTILSNDKEIHESPFLEGTSKEKRREKKLELPEELKDFSQEKSQKVEEKEELPTFYSLIKKQTEVKKPRFKRYVFKPSKEWLVRQSNILECLNDCKAVYENSNKDYGANPSYTLRHMELIHTQLSGLLVKLKNLDVVTYNYAKHEEEHFKSTYLRISVDSHKFQVKALLRNILKRFEPELLKKPIPSNSILKVDLNNSERKLLKLPEQTNYSPVQGVELDDNWKEIKND